MAIACSALPCGAGLTVLSYWDYLDYLYIHLYINNPNPKYAY